MTTTIATFTNDQLHRSTPSIFASTPWHHMSDRYRFVPTIEVVDLLRDRGFQPVRAQQSRSRIEGKGAFTERLIHFRNESLIDAPGVGEEIPELVLVNSHDGTSSYQLIAGIFRLSPPPAGVGRSSSGLGDSSGKPGPDVPFGRHSTFNTNGTTCTRPLRLNWPQPL